METTMKPPLESPTSDRLVLDERQKLEHYRAGYRAYNVMLILCFTGMAAAHFFLPESDIDLVLAAVGLIGGAVNETILYRSGWEDYVGEQLASNRAFRRRAIRRELYFGAGIFVFAFAESYFLESNTIGESLVQGLIMGVALGLVGWWVDVKQKAKEQASTEN